MFSFGTNVISSTSDAGAEYDTDGNIDGWSGNVPNTDKNEGGTD